MTLDDIIVAALTNLGRPAHLDEIRSEAIRIAATLGDNRKRFNVRTKMARNPIFQNVEPRRGIWQLAPGTLAGTKNTPSQFAVGDLYTRAQIAEAIGLPSNRRNGGTWATGYDRWNGEFFIFCNVGVAGRSGPNHANRWNGKFLHWFGKSTSRLGQPIIDQMVAGVVPVHVFWRGDDKAPFTYAGRASAWEISDQSPVAVVWSFDTAELDAGVPLPAIDYEAMPTKFRRGPPPSPGERKLSIPEGETALYLMQLDGECQSMRPTLPSDHFIIKVGISNSPLRRLSELNEGFPPGSKVGWRLRHQRQFANGMAAYLAESECLEQLRESGHWIGGEFAAVSAPALVSLIKDHWSSSGV